jgi:murein DD-endopeptidase MepM/ murein hydrolase activator NlpD
LIKKLAQTILLSFFAFAISSITTAALANPQPLSTLAVNQTVLKTGSVLYSFSQSAHALKIPQTIINQYEHIFSRSLNFQHNIRPQDKFLVLYQQTAASKTQPAHNTLLLAQFIRNGHTTSAIHFSYPHQDGFYAPDGTNFHAKFLNAPLEYKYISSKFNPHRLDPITHHIQPHNGVDYAAHSSTPIHSVGNGKVIYRGWEHGYGNVVKIKYTPHIIALYAHLSHFTHLHYGEQVRENQIIGYVGMTGWATGPHLHFGWYIDGKPVNPMTRPIIHLAPVPTQYKTAFKQHRQQLLSQLDSLLNKCQHTQSRHPVCTQTTTSV